MEEIMTIDGRQFKLTTDRPLTASEKAQVIADIRKQTGCSSCHQPRTLSTGVKSMAPSCTATGKGSGDTVTLAAAPLLGVQPYTVEFLKAPYNSYITDGSDAVTIDFGRLTGGTYTDFTSVTVIPTTANPQTNVAEAPDAVTPMISAPYILDDADVAGATVKAGDAAGASIVFKVFVTDSCPVVSGGPKTCSEICRAYITCIPPTCNFIVS